MQEHFAFLVLSFLRGITLAEKRACVLHYGSALATLTAHDAQNTRLQAALQNLPLAQARAEKEQAFMEAHGIALLPLTSEAYPRLLRESPDAPLLLFFKGTADLNAPHTLSVVGTRHITEYGKDAVQHLVEDVQKALPNALIVSGLAYGVDIHAHRQALQHQLPTVAVLAHGLDRIYPSRHRDTAAEMLVHGGLLTEYPTTTVPDKGNFVRRNRIVAAMSPATVLIESASQGGALITARLALEYGRDVFAFPGRSTDIYSAGCNALIRNNGAQLATSAADILHALGWTTATPKPEAVQRELFPMLTADETKVVRALQTVDFETISNLLALLQMPYAAANALLYGLELKGVIKSLPGGLFRLLK